MPGTQLTFNVVGNDVSGSKTVKKLGDQVEKTTGGMASSFKKLGLLAAGAGVVGLFKGAVDAASDAAESASKVSVVFGDQAKQILDASKTSATAMGLSSRAYLEATGTLGNLLVSLDIAPDKAADMSQQFVKLAGDLASFNNVSPEEALLAIKSGLTGETEPLKRFGVNMNDATLHAEALKLGLISTIKDALDPQTKALAAGSLIMAQTGTAQGDFARTSSGLANQQRILAAQVDDLKAKIGAQLLPALVSIAGFLSGTVIPAFTTAGHFVQDNAMAFKILGIAVLTAWVAFKGYTIVKSAAAALSLFGARYSQMVAQMSYGNKAQRAASTGLQAFGGVAGIASTAVIGLGLALYGLNQHRQEEARNLAAAKALAQEYIGVLEQTKGAMNEVARATVIKKLADEGAYDAATKFGISQDIVTQAALGNANAIRQLTDATNGNMAAINGVLIPAVKQSDALKTASDHYQQATTQTDRNTTSQEKNAAAAAGTTGKLTEQKSAVDKLSGAFDTLNGKTVDATTADIRFRDSQDSVKTAVDSNGRSLSLNTTAGRANITAVLDSIQAAQQHAQAVSKQTGLVSRGTAVFRTDIGVLRAHLTSLGLNKNEVQRLIDKYAHIPAMKHTTVTADTAGAVNGINAVRDALGRLVQRTDLSVTFGSLGTGITAHAQGAGRVKSKLALFGEYGPELGSMPGARIRTATETASLLGSGGGDTYLYVTVQGSLIRENELGSVVVSALENAGRSGVKANISGMIR